MSRKSVERFCKSDRQKPGVKPLWKAMIHVKHTLDNKGTATGRNLTGVENA